MGSATISCSGIVVKIGFCFQMLVLTILGSSGYSSVDICSFFPPELRLHLILATFDPKRLPRGMSLNKVGGSAIPQSLLTSSSQCLLLHPVLASLVALVDASYRSPLYGQVPRAGMVNAVGLSRSETTSLAQLGKTLILSRLRIVRNMVVMTRARPRLAK